VYFSSKVSVEPDTAAAEDESTVRDHISVMKSELSKPSPNMDVVNDRMCRTFAARQDMIHIASVEVVLESYPALGFEIQA